MTVAVCYKCGSMKFGAFNACPDCNALPTSKDDYALSLAMTEHYFPKQELEKMGRQIARGEELHIDPEIRWRFIRLLQSEGVGEESLADQGFQPTEAMVLLDDPDSPPSPRKWWQFWKR